MAPFMYTLCALTSIACFVLLWRSWRSAGSRLLFWSALCFAALSVNNVVLILDKMVYVEIDLIFLRLGASLAAVVLMLYGLVWEEQ
ncbi:MAG TPA: DUF5985 family protein [Ramlibacter sp.]|uniref:DUF5985 family protein n=1 Tax=Ramlibacter sp. TaxID=1917967 RepID=UPI002B7927FD|nr:DUF5985 family protein [Ramlibacter sp.]HVZ43138.1 DUF5985 family protein [Ramlibacter sp.]